VVILSATREMSQAIHLLAPSGEESLLVFGREKAEEEERSLVARHIREMQNGVPRSSE
jgi:hypothetical protein